MGCSADDEMFGGLSHPVTCRFQTCGHLQACAMPSINPPVAERCSSVLPHRSSASTQQRTKDAPDPRCWGYSVGKTIIHLLLKPLEPTRGLGSLMSAIHIAWACM